MFRAYKYKLIPNTEQLKMLAQWEGSTRWLWNQFLAATTAQYAQDKKFIWGFDLKKQIPDLKKQHEWLKQVPAHALQNVAFDLDRALKRSTGKNRDQGFPKFKSKHRNTGSIKIDQVGTHIKISDTHVVIPKIGAVKWRYHRPITGKLKSISVTRDIRGWYVSVLCEIFDVDPVVDVDQNRTVGIDLGVSSFATLSDGTKIASQNFLKKQLRRLKYQQRFLKNKKQGSNNSRKQCDRVARIHARIRCQRLDWLHKLSNQLTRDYDVICVEDLKVRELLEKKQLSRSIADQGWSMFVSQLAYKAALRGKHLTRINTYLPSTKTCSCCGTERKMKLSDRVYICENTRCADYLKTKDRDQNAAINIHAWGLMATGNIRLHTPGTGGIQACGDTPTYDIQAIDWYHEVSAKQEAACPLGPQ
jgi:putative transposase